MARTKQVSSNSSEHRGRNTSLVSDTMDDVEGIVLPILNQFSPNMILILIHNTARTS